MYRLSAGDLAGQYFAVSGPWSRNVFSAGNHQSRDLDLVQLLNMIRVPESGTAAHISCDIGSEQHRSDACCVLIVLREGFRREEELHRHVDDGCHATLLHGLYSGLG